MASAAEYQADDAAADALAASQAKYFALCTELEGVEHRPELIGVGSPLYLTDGNIDAENVADSGIARDSANYWDAMYAQATSAAGQRAEAYGLDINALLGRVIY